MADDIAEMSFEDKLGEVLTRSLPKLGPEARQQIAAIISPESLAIIAGILVVWVASHFFGVGEAIDIIIGVIGVVAIGLAVFDGLDELYEFAKVTYYAKSSADLDKAADHFAKAVSILGVTAVLALIFKGRPKTHKGTPVKIGKPPKSSGLRYKPKTKGSSSMAEGTGQTSWWGDVVSSTKGSASTRALVNLHEKVHQILTPKLNFLRNIRVQNRANSYVKSAFRMYLEEALAETIAQVGVKGILSGFKGVTFPVRYGYVTIFLKSSKALPVVPEIAGLIGGSLLVSGVQFRYFMTTEKPRVR